MPIYRDPSMTSWTEKGYMDFMVYEDFKALYNKQTGSFDKALLTFFYFTGSRPGECLFLKRSDIQLGQGRLFLRILTLKRKDKHVRILEWPVKKFIEMQEFWDYVKDLPDEFYVFGLLRPPNKTSPRWYIKRKFGKSAYFFRHNFMSLLAQAGATDEQLMAAKGAKTMESVAPYKHLSEKAMAGISKKIIKAFTKRPIFSNT